MSQTYQGLTAVDLAIRYNWPCCSGVTVLLPLCVMELLAKMASVHTMHTPGLPKHSIAQVKWWRGSSWVVWGRHGREAGIMLLGEDLSGKGAFRILLPIFQPILLSFDLYQLESWHEFEKTQRFSKGQEKSILSLADLLVTSFYTISCHVCSIGTALWYSMAGGIGMGC